MLSRVNWNERYSKHATSPYVSSENYNSSEYRNPISSANLILIGIDKQILFIMDLMES